MRSDIAVLAVSMLLAGCGAAAPSGDGDGLALVRTDSVALQETEASYLAAPAYLVQARSGDRFISDPMNCFVLQFRHGGEFVRQFGKRGKGPGELWAPVSLALVGDSLLAVADWGTRHFSLFDTRTGAFVRNVAFEGYPFWLTTRNDTIWMGNVNHIKNTSIGLWRVGLDTLKYWGLLPTEYLKVPLLRESHPYAAMIPLRSGSLVGFTGHGPLFLVGSNGRAKDTIDVPVIRRRGVPADLPERFRNSNIDSEEIASLSSSLMGLHELADGSVAVVHMDASFKENLTTAQVYVSILQRDFSAACVDAPISVGADSRPTVGFAGDTLMVLEQRVTSNTRAVATIRSFRLSTEACRWAPIDGAGRIVQQ